MKLEAFELPMAKAPQGRKRAPTIRILIALTLFLTIAPIYYPSLRYSVKKVIQDSNTVERNKGHLKIVPSSTNQDVISKTTLSSSTKREISVAKESENTAKEGGGEEESNTARSSHHSHGGIEEKCELFSGEWVPNPEAPYYTNMTCWEIQEHQNCMKFGRPDTGFMKWRWKPDGCELPLFDPQQFLELVRGKSLAFVGDSVARNQMQSLICLLSRVTYPLDVSDANVIEIKRWTYPNYNFNITIFWSPFLVKSNTTDPSRLFPIFLDEFDEVWTREIQGYDYVIISAHHWFRRPAIFFENRQIIGCLYCPDANLTHFTPQYSYQKAFRTAFKALNSLEKYEGVIFMRTVAPQHFENGTWDNGGDCVRQRPFKRNETELNGDALEMYEIQLKEFRIAQEEGRKKGLKFRLFDVTFPMLLRPDGHPSKYGHWPHETRVMPNDCVHWCLPGPIDSWNDFLQELLRREVEGRSSIS